MRGRLKTDEWKELFQRYVKFCVVGGSGVFVDMGIIFILAGESMLDWNPSISKAIAAEAAIINNFYWNDIWSFRGLTDADDNMRKRMARFMRFNLVCLSGIILSIALLNIQLYLLGLNLLLANLNAIILVSVWNFLLVLKFGWKRRDKKA